MRRLMISALVSSVLFAAAIAMQRSPPTEPSAGTNAMSLVAGVCTAASIPRLASDGKLRCEGGATPAAAVGR
jgi:hypothetical protein